MAKSRDEYIKEHGGDEITFNLVDKATVKRLQKKGDVKLPYKDLDEEKDEKWNTKLLNSKLMENITSGKPVTELSKSIYDVVGRNETSAMRNARTMMTGAENAGRQDSYEDLTEQGVVIKKVWIATPDDRTRETHFDLDGEEVDVDEEFSNGCMYPGDPNGDPSEVYNCRCSMRTHIVGFKKNDGSVVEIKGERDTTMHEQQMEAEESRREAEKEKKITVVEKWDRDKFEEESKKMVISEEDKKYIYSNYIGTGQSWTINDSLRKGSTDKYLNEDDFATIKALDNAIAQNPLKENVEMYRYAGVGYAHDMLGIQRLDKVLENPPENFQDLLSGFVGTTIKDDGFMSCSTVKGMNLFDNKKVLLEFDVPKGTGAYISEKLNESEAILGRGTSYRITDVVMEGEKKWDRRIVIKAEILQ